MKQKIISAQTLEELLKKANGTFTANAKLIIVMSSATKLFEAGTMLDHQFGNIPVIGVSTVCSFANQKIVRGGITAVSLEGDLAVATGVITDTERVPVKQIKKVQDALEQVNPQQEDTILFEVCTGKEEMLVSTLNSVVSKRGVPVIGGTAFSGDESDACVYYKGEVYTQACVFAIIRYLTGKITCYKQNIYHSEDEEELLVTEASERELIQINDQPAAEVYAKKLNISTHDIPRYILSNPLARVVGTEKYVVAINEVLKTKGLSVYKKVGKNDKLKILSLSDYRVAVTKEISQIEETFKHSSIEGVLSVNCIYRYLLFERDQYTNYYNKEMNRLCSHSGFISAGEQFNRQHINQTMVCAIFTSKCR